MSERLTDQEWHDNAVNGALRKALTVMVERQGKLEEAEAAIRARNARLESAWKIAEPHLLYSIRRRCLAVLADTPQ
jgi:hypothetical protein